jgi:chromosome partitioning protein
MEVLLTMRTFAVMNQKGGCGKTTIAINLASALASLERRVLLIDLDPQAHSSVGLGLRRSDAEITTYELLMDPAVLVEDAHISIGERFDIVTSSTVLSGVEQELADRMGREDRLANKISQIRQDAYDFIVIDCPPSVGLLTFNALIAAGEVIIPVDASFFSLHGLGKLRETIEVIEHELDRRFRVHVVCNNLDTRTHFSKELLHEIEKFHSAELTDTFISHTVRLKEAAARGVSIFQLDRQSKAARQFHALARELIEKTAKIETADMEQWMEKLHGPKRVSEGVLFALDHPQATHVAVTGEFANWSREGISMRRDPEDGLWKIVLDIQPGEYEYRFIVDGVWMRDPSNNDYIRNEFGQENSLLIV